MFGDSTTALRPGAVQKVYAQRVEEALGSEVVHNAGVGGNTTTMARRRFERDVLAHQPRVVVIQFGLNDAAIDVWKEPPVTTSRVSLADYEANLRWMIASLREHGAAPILMTTNPARWTPVLKERYGKPPYRPDEVDGFETPALVHYNETVRKIASDLHVPLVDVRAAYDARVKTGETIDPLLLDGMHPNDRGHQLVADLLLPVLREQLR